LLNALNGVKLFEMSVVILLGKVPIQVVYLLENLSYCRAPAYR